MNQTERLDYLVEKFREDSVRYRDLGVPDSVPEKRRILRSLMNIRMPKGLDEETLKVQDDYLKERIKENGIVKLEDLSPVQEARQDGAEMTGKNDHSSQIYLWQGDITRLQVDAIVNAANSQMLGCFVPMHSCIDNCIHTFAGVQLRAECGRQMNQLRLRYGREYEQPTAVPMMTEGYNLPAKKVIHVVGPIVEGGLTKEHEELLTACYRNTLDLCKENKLESVAFCCISTGVFMFPNERAAEIAVETVKSWLDENESSIRVVFNVFKEMDLDIYKKLLS